jgi:SAM-dependent methyltransferase
MADARIPMRDPCAFSAGRRQAVLSARFFAAMFPAGGTVIDVGFGQGVFLEEAMAAGLHPIGVDRDLGLVGRAKSRGLNAVAGDITDLGNSIKEPADGIMAAHVIEHLSPSALVKLLHDMSTLVRQGGLAVLATPNFRDWRVASEWFWNDPTHVRPYPPGAIQQMINPEDWIWDTWGYVPIAVTRELPRVLLKRLLHGSDYGKSGIWCRMVRAMT